MATARRLAGMIGLALLPMACGTAGSSGGSDLVGTSWRGATIRDVRVLDDAPPTMKFEEKRAVGSTGCNNYFASVQIMGSGMRFGKAGATRRACAAPAMAQEKNFLDTLQEVRAHRVRGEFLELLDDSQLVLIRLRRDDGGSQRLE